MSTGTAPLLRLEGVTYHYPNGLQAVGGVDLTLARGEIVSIVGPSGCGKSTLLSLVAELAHPTTGRIVWDESYLASRGEQRLSMVFQRDTVFPWRTVEKNVQFGMECRGATRKERAETTQRLLEIGGLEQFAKSFPRALSGGMRRRLALLTSLAIDPSVLLLDEPFGGLDEPTRVGLLNDVLKLAYDYKVSVLLVTHDIGEAISISDRILVMSNRPTRVNHVVDVGFGHDRDVFTIRETPEYAELYSTVWRELWSSIRGGSEEVA